MAKDCLIVWDKATFDVGIECIDNQHRALVDSINELAFAIDSEEEKSVLSALFTKLYDYTKFHFKAEEAYFINLNQDDCLLHELQHKHFIEELDRLIVADEHEATPEELLFFLTDWLLQHIQIEDKKFLQKHLKRLV